MRYRSPRLLAGIALLTLLVGVLAGVLATRRPAWASSLAIPEGLVPAILAVGMGLVLGAYGALLAHTLQVARRSANPTPGVPSPLVEALLAGIPLLFLLGVLLYALLST
ncbi:hypothetical protein HRbin23_00570 [bacterium HR23]|nr:hypothetical protein HRbin23_00570 [bacterium HR23]